MNELINVLNQDGCLVVSSREVARNFNKRHNDVIKAIENKIENLTTEKFVVKNYFIPSVFAHKGNMYDEYLLTRDGFSFIVMGFTGKEADQWKLKYIDVFNKMEERIKQQVIPRDLSPQLQFMINMELRQNQLETAITEAKAEVEETKDKVEAIREVISINPKNWRTETSDLIRKIGGKIGDYSKPRRESYALLEERAGLRLSTRLTNKKGRALIAGASKPQADKINYLDVIGEEKRFIEIYIAIVKELAIKYGIA